MKKIIGSLLLFLICTVWVEAQTAKIDSVVNWGNGKIYFTRNNEYIRYDLTQNQADGGYPAKLNAQTWPGMVFPAIDAAFDAGNGKVYLFFGSNYIRFDKKANRSDPGYPKAINNITWPGVTFKRIDAAFAPGNGKAYFFSGNQYIRFDLPADKADPGYPKPINNSTWPSLPFSNIDAALAWGSNIYFFRGEQFARFDLIENKGFTDYPKTTRTYWSGLRFQGMFDVPDESTADNVGPDFTVNNIKGFRITSHNVKLSETVKMSNTVLGWVQIRVLPSGKLLAIYQNDQDVIIDELNSNYTLAGQKLRLKNYWYSDCIIGQDGSIYLALGRDVNNTYISGYPNTLYVKKLSASYREIYDTYIFGGNGHEPGKSWFDGRSKARLAISGSQLAVYQEVQKNWADPGQNDDIHNGDMFSVLDGNGKKLDKLDHFWTASHSSTIQITTGEDGELYTATIGDAYPYGLQIYHRRIDKNWVLWPPKEDYIPYEEVNSTNAAGILEYFGPMGKDLFALMGTLEHPNIGVFDKVDVLFFKFSTDGKILGQKWLSRTPDQDESVITAWPIGENYIVGWGKGNDYDENWKPGNITLSIINNQGDFIIKPKNFDRSFGTYSQFSGGFGNKIYWSVADNGSSTFSLFEVTPE